ncbi:MAG: hypothetical protein RL701_5747 [Pseudomonadota bacterium]
MRSSSVNVISCLWLAGCAVAHDVGEAASALSSDIQLSAACKREVEDAFDGLPKHLECTGLYADLATKTVAPGREQFMPAYPLWSDASVKTRWVYLPKGEKIDASDPNSWVFPNGTRFWKEFRNPSGDKRIETRIFMKTDAGGWSRATYEWNAGETDAVLLETGRDIEVEGKAYHIPSRQQCDECHKGRRERVLGFEQVNLTLAGSSGFNVSQLLEQDLIENLTGPDEPQLGPDPNNSEAQALGWLHTNCGVSCHNDNSNSKAYANGMRLLLRPEQLDGRATSNFDAIKTTLDVNVSALQWNGKKRIVPGNPEESWLYTLITQRGDSKTQMPPLASTQVDTAHTNLVRDWITSLKPQSNTTSE